MNIFEKKKILLLREKIELKRKEAYRVGRFSLFHTKFAIEKFSQLNDYKNLKYFYDIIEGHDKNCNIPYNVGISIDRLATDNTVLIHRTNLSLDKSKNGIPECEELYSIMKDGLKNYGHLNAYGGSANLNSLPGLSLTTTPLIGLAGYINLVSSYKNNDATILMAFPKELVNSQGDIVDVSYYPKVYDLSDNPPRVKREYMLGVLLKKEGKYDEFYLRDDIINSMEKTIEGEKTH